MLKSGRLFAAIAAALICLCACVSAQAISGQRYETFIANYSDNITFINENDDRHLMPLIFAKSDLGVDRRQIYELYGDVLHVTVRVDPSGEIIEECKIVLTAPQGMTYGSATYNDFAISGYHSYALLMAMHTAPEPVQRYALVTEVVEGMAAGNGYYASQIGVYKLQCTRENYCATLLFTNSQVINKDDGERENSDPVQPAVDDGDDESNGLG